MNNNYSLSVVVSSLKAVELRDIISGTGGITKSGAGVLKISGPVNTYTGKTLVTGGTLFIDRESSLGGNPASPTADQLKLDGGTLQVNNSVIIGLVNGNSGITLGASGGTFLTDPGVQFEVQNEITGSGTFTKTGTGTAKLSASNIGQNTYTGKTIVLEGVLSIDNVNRLGTNPGTFTTDQLTINGGTLNAFDTFSFNNNVGVTLGASGGTISVTSTKVLTLAEAVTGSGSLTKTLAGALTLSVANDYSGGTTLSAGTLNINHANALGSGALTISGSSTVIDNTSSGSVTLAGNAQNWNADFTFTGTQNLNLGTGAVALGATRTVTTTANTLTVGGVISGSTYGINKAGSGTMVLTGINTYSGATTVSAGKLVGVTGASCDNSVLTVSSTTATNSVTITDNTMQWKCAGLIYSAVGTLNFAFGNIELSTTVAPLKVDGDVAFTSTPIVSIQAANIPAGEGVYPLVNWSGAKSGTEPTTVVLPPHVTGELFIGEAPDTDPKTLYLYIQGSTQPLRWFTAGGGIWAAGTGGWKDSAATPAEVSYLETTIPGDAVQFEDMVSSGLGPFSIALNTTVSPASVTANNPTKNYTISGSGKISGATSLTKSGSGTLTLVTANDYTGGTTISAGTLQLGNGSANGSVAGSIVNNAALIVNNGASQAMSTVVSGSGTVTKIASTTLTLSGANTFSGALSVKSGTVSVASVNDTSTSGPLGNSANAVVLGDTSATGTLQYTGGSASTTKKFTMAASGTGAFQIDSGTLTLNGLIDGSGVLNKTGSGALTLPILNTFSGGLTLTAGTLNINHGSALGSSGTFTIGAGTIDNTTSGSIILNDRPQSWSGDFTFTGTQDLDLGSGAVALTASRNVTVVTKNLSVGGIISGAYGITKAGDGTMILSGVSTYTGQTLINAGTLKVNSINSVSAVTGSSLGQPTTGANGTIAIGVDITNATLIYTGGTATSDRVINLAGTTGGGTIQNDGSGPITFSTDFATPGSGNKVLTLQGSNTDANTIGGIIKDKITPTRKTVSIIKDGVGKWVLSGQNTFTGNLTVKDGTLAVASVNNIATAGPLGANANAVTLGDTGGKSGILEYTGGTTASSSKKFTMAAGGTGVFQIDTGGDLTISGLVDGSGALTKTGAGTLTLSTATHSYSGATTISAGKLVVSSSIAVGSAVTVGSSGTLGGSGTVNGTVAVNGSISPGNSVGTLNTGSETWNSGGSYAWEISNVSGTPVAGVDWDLLNITGTLTVGATIGSKFTIYVSGTPTGWDNTQNYTWLIAQTTSGVVTFATNVFAINTTGFTPSGGLGTGGFTIYQSGNNVYLQFTHLVAGNVNVSRAWGTYMRIPVATVLAQTSGGTPPRTVTAASSSSGDYVLLSGSEILFAPGADVNSTRTVNYTVTDSSPTPLTASSTITVTVTNAVGAQHPVISVSGSTVTATFFGMPGFIYKVQKTTSITPADWQDFATSQTADSITGKLAITDTLSNGASAYYRLVQQN